MSALVGVRLVQKNQPVTSKQWSIKLPSQAGVFQYAVVAFATYTISTGFSYLYPGFTHSDVFLTSKEYDGVMARFDPGAIIAVQDHPYPYNVLSAAVGIGAIWGPPMSIYLARWTAEEYEGELWLNYKSVAANSNVGVVVMCNAYFDVDVDPLAALLSAP